MLIEAEPTPAAAQSTPKKVWSGDVNESPAEVAKIQDARHRLALAESDEIKGRASLASTVSTVCFVLMLLCIAIALLADERQHWLGVSAAAGFLTLFLGFQIVAQLLYIRAKLTEK